MKKDRHRQRLLPLASSAASLTSHPAAELGSIVIKEALNRANVKPEQVDHVYMSCVIQWPVWAQERRSSGFPKAGLPIEHPAVTVNVVCGSGLNCVNMAAQMIGPAMPHRRCRRHGEHGHGSVSP